jgi:molybdate transport system substrate-binding protein
MNTAITGISSMATRLLLADVCAAWREQGGAELRVESVGGVDAARRVNDGENVDLVFLAVDALAKLAGAGRLVVGSETPIVRSPVAVAVQRGAARPAVDTEAALREAVLAAPRVGYSTGPSGVALLKLFERWGVADVLRARAIQAPAGVAVGSLLARGDIDLGFQQLSELMHVDGADVLGSMPPGCEIVTTFGGAICRTSTHPEPARAFLDFIRSPAAASAQRRHGMLPA